MLARRSVGAAYVATVLLAQIGHASGANCPAFPASAFEPAAARRVMKCTEPASIGAAQQPVGYLAVGDLALVSSSRATCGKQVGELKVSVTPEPAFLVIGKSSCSLEGVSLKRSDASATAAVEMRLDFDKCTAGPRKSSVVMNVAKVPDAATQVSMMPFWTQVCTKQIKAEVPLLTSTKLTFSEVAVGNSTCFGTPIQSYPNVDKTACKQLCIAEVEAHVGSFDTSKDMCRGFSFNASGVPGTNACHLYKGDGEELSIKVSTGAGNIGVNCWKLTAQDSKFHEATPPPPTKEAITAMQANLPKLSVAVAASSANILTFASADKCFQPFNWITLEDALQQPISVSVRESEWEELLALIPSERRLETADELTATIYADRAIYGVAPVTTPTPVPQGPIVPPCPAKAAEPVSMTMTFVLATLALMAGGGGFFLGKTGHAATIMNHPSMKGAEALIAASQHNSGPAGPPNPGMMSGNPGMMSGMASGMPAMMSGMYQSGQAGGTPTQSMGPPTNTTGPVGLSTNTSTAPPSNAPPMAAHH